HFGDEGIAHPIPKRERPVANKTDSFLCHPALDRLDVRKCFCNMVERNDKAVSLHRAEQACMMFRQNERRSDCPEHTIVDRRNLRHLNRFQRWMDGAASERLIVGGTARRGRDAQAVASECLKMFSANLNIEDDRTFHCFNCRFIERKGAQWLLLIVKTNDDFEKRIFDNMKRRFGDLDDKLLYFIGSPIRIET